MPPIVSSIEVARPPDEVFKGTDPSRFAEWQDDVVGVRVDGDRPPTVGLAVHHDPAGRRHRADDDPGGHRAQPSQAQAARGVDGPIRPSATITVEPLDGGARSRVTFALDFEGHGIGRPLVPAVRRQATRAAPASYRRLKERLEHGALRG